MYEVAVIGILCLLRDPFLTFTISSEFSDGEAFTLMIGLTFFTVCSCFSSLETGAKEIIRTKEKET